VKHLKKKGKIRGVNIHPIKMESIQPGTSSISEGQGPQPTDIKLGQGQKLKVLNNFMKEHEEPNHKKIVSFQERNNTCHFLVYSAPKEKGSTSNQIQSEISAMYSSSTEEHVLLVDRFPLN
jgi:hypothetical protein